MLYKNANLIILEQLVKDNQIVLVDFWANWCVPCKQFSSIFSEMAEQYENIAFTQINVEDDEAQTALLQIKSIPHLLIFKDGIIVYSESGAMPASALKELIEQTIKVDISDTASSSNQ